VIYRAAATLSYDNRERATAGLRGQLRLMAAAGGGTPDWTTLSVEGPTESVGLLGRIWFKWTATVVAEICEEAGDEVLDAAVGGGGRPTDGVAVEETAPQARRG